MSNLTKYTLLLAVVLLGAAFSATAEQPVARRLVSSRESPSDMFNDLLKGVAPALEKAIGHLKFKDYNRDGVKLTNLRTFDFDCDDGCLSGSISGMTASITVHKFSLRVHSRYKAKKGWITLQGQCDFQVQDTAGSGSATITSLSPFQLSGVNVNVHVGKLVPSCGGLSGAIINVAVHLFQDKIKGAIENGAEDAIKQILEGHGTDDITSSDSSSNNVGCLPNGEYCSGSDSCCGSCGWNGLCGDSKLRGGHQQSSPFVVAAEQQVLEQDNAQCIQDMQKCGHDHQNCCNGGKCLWMGGCDGGNGGSCCDNQLRFEQDILAELGWN